MKRLLVTVVQQRNIYLQPIFSNSAQKDYTKLQLIYSCIIIQVKWPPALRLYKSGSKLDTIASLA